MKSTTNGNFRKLFNALPERIQKTAEKKFGDWQEDPYNPGLHFKKIETGNPKGRYFWSVRVNWAYRALGIPTKDSSGAEMVEWFWIGNHSEYDRMLRQS